VTLLGGVVSYSPNANFFGSDSFTYTISDGNGGTATATVNVTVTAVNDAPVATDNAYSVDEDGVLNVVGPGVLANDTDVDGDPLTAVLVAGPTRGTLTFNADGSFLYSPNTNFNGSDSFTYRANDGSVDSNVVTVTITVNPVNDAPVAVNDTASGNEDTPITGSVLTNDSDVESSPLTAALVTGPANGTLSFNADGTFTYTPNLDFNGTDSFTYLANDGTADSNLATVTINVSAVNDAPTVANAIPNQTATEDSSFNFQFAPNTFADADVGDTLIYSARLAGGGALPAWLAFDPVTRTFSGTPGNANVGTISIEVIATDGAGATATDTFDLVVTNTNDAPTVANPIPDQNATEDAAFSFQFASNTFADVDAGATLTYFVQLAGGGALPTWLTFNSTTRTFSGTPANGDVGTISIDVVANDGNGGTVTDTFNITVANVNDAPTVANPIPNQTATEDSSFNFQFAPNTFADVDVGDTLTYSAQLAGGGPLPAWLIFNATTRTFSGTPADGDVGTISIEVIATDVAGATVTDTFALVVANTNDAPVAGNDSYSVNEDGALLTPAPGVLANDSDVEGDPLTSVLVLGPTNGTLTLNANGSFLYTPNANYNGTDSFTYRVNDGLADSNIATVTINVIAVNDNPAANDDALTVAEDSGPTVVDVLANDSFAPDVGETLTVTAVGAATNGTVTLSGGVVRYTPNVDFFGADSFTYTISDGNGGTATAIVNITVTAVNDTPVANDDLASTPINIPVIIDVRGNDTDTEPGTLTVGGIVVNPAQGAAIDNGDGTITFTPALNFSGTATVTYTLTDAGGLSDTATVTINVGANSPPAGTNAIRGLAEDGTYTLQAADFDFSDADAGQSLAGVRIDTLPALGTLRLNGVPITGVTTVAIADINANRLTYTPALNGNGTAYASFTFSVQDSAGGYDAAPNTFTFDVSAVNDAPAITAPGSVPVTEDVVTPITGISFVDVDAGGAAVTVTFSAPSGSLAAVSGGGVTVGGSGTGALTLTGGIADINAFVAASAVQYTPVANAISNVTLTVAIDDGGNTGAGGNQSSYTTLTLALAAVNDPPVNQVPGAQATPQDTNLAFNSANTNRISVSDIDVGAGPVQVTLTGTNGVITLSGTTGLTFGPGDGTADATMVFTGSVADVNAALDGLVFTPTAGYVGAASIQVTTSDLGGTGSGGARIDTDTVAINVTSVAPNVTNVEASSPDGAYGIGSVVLLTVRFDQTLVVDTTGGTPALLLETGAVDRNAVYVSGSGTNTLTFSYTVQAGDVSPDLDYVSPGALTLNGATIRNVFGDDATLTLPTVGGAGSIGGQDAVVIDGIRPTANIVVADTALTVGETSPVTITFSEAVTGLTAADFVVANGTLSGPTSADGGITWTATLTPTANVEDTSNLVALANTGVQDAAGNTGTGTTDSNNYAIDTRRPTATIVVTDTALITGETSLVTITFSEAVSGFALADLTAANGTLSDLSSADGGITWTATLTPAAGISDPTNLITLDDTGVADAAGNAGAGATDSNNYAIDTIAPSVVSVSVPADGAYVAGQTLELIVNLTEPVLVDTAGGTPRIAITLDTGGTVYADYVSGSSTSALVFRLVVAPGQLDPTGITIGGAIDPNGATLRDAGGNDAATALNGVGTTTGVRVDAVNPQATSVARADPDPVQGASVRFTVTFSEAVAGVDAADFDLVATGSATGTVGTVTAIDARTYVVTVNDVRGVGALRLDVDAAGTGIVDAAGNGILGGFVGEQYSLVAPPEDSDGLVRPAGVDPIDRFSFRPLPGDSYAPPFLATEFVAPAVRESQAVRGEQARALAGVRSVNEVAEIRAESLGAGLGLDRVLYVLPAVAEVQGEIEQAQSRVASLLDTPAIGAVTLLDYLAPFASATDAAQSAAAVPALDAATPTRTVEDGASPQPDAAPALAALLAGRIPDAGVAGKVAAAAPSFSAQLKDAAAKMRPVPLSGTGTARTA
jgi:VCBS repeat-containing protein